MPDVKVAPPPLYYAQADGTSFKDSAVFGADLEKKTPFRNLIADFMAPISLAASSNFLSAISAETRRNRG
jgi:hypothetical protein